jgi:nucleotide-binding universal stress UspA family protein
MSYRSLLVFLDQSPTCSARTQVAARLATALDTHLVGLAPTGVVDMMPFQESGSALTEFAARAWDTLRDRAEKATQRFSDDCKTARVKSFEAVIDEADEATSLVRHAHCSDLCILTQTDPGADGDWAARQLVERVVLQSARPTLIIPRTGKFETIGHNILVAWDDSREAVRAMTDALPLLRLARSIHVVSWNETGAKNDKALRQGLDALQNWLMWHGVTARARSETCDGRIAEAILSTAATLNADLVVMGAYGHARWSERILGGATRGLLSSMTVPVLMSH